MPKQIIKNLAQQIGQLAGETFETVKKQPQEMAGKVLEQMGVSTSNPQTGQPASRGEPTVQADEAAAKARLGEMKDREAAQSQQAAAQISHQIEQEIDQLQKAREEQLRRRRESTFEGIPNDQSIAQPQEAPIVPTSKPGRQFGGGRRVKSAQEQAQPETAGRRVGG